MLTPKELCHQRVIVLARDPQSEPRDRDFLLGVTQDPSHDGKPVMESISLQLIKASYLGGQRSCQMGDGCYKEN